MIHLWTDNEVDIWSMSEMQTLCLTGVNNNHRPSVIAEKKKKKLTGSSPAAARSCSPGRRQTDGVLVTTGSRWCTGDGIIMIGYLCSDVMSQPVTQGMMGSGERLSVKDTEDKARFWRRAGLATGQPITSRLPQRHWDRCSSGFSQRPITGSDRAD